jgi:hypothetical protein
MKNNSIASIVAVLVLSLSSALAQTTLVPKSPFPGVLRNNAASFAIGSDGYVGTGGLSTTIQGSDDFWKYNSITDTWTQISSYPLQTTDAVGFSISGKGYVLGGYDGWSLFYSELYEYDPNLNSWISKSPYPNSGVGIYGSSAAVSNGLAYVGTGMASNPFGYINDFYCYDPVNDNWTIKAAIPISSSAYSFAFMVNNKIYFGGGELPFSDKLYEYDPNINSWTQKNNLPFASTTIGLVGATGFSTNVGGFIFGGWHYIYGKGAYIHQYIHSTDSWNLTYADSTFTTSTPHYGNNVFGASVFVVNNIPFITQGVSGGNTYFPGLYSVNISTGLNNADYSEYFFVSNVVNNKILIRNSYSDDNVFILIYNTNGQLVDKAPLYKGINELYLKNINSGIYLYGISSKAELILTGKLISY